VSYRLIENVYALDANGVPRLAERIPVAAHNFLVKDGDVYVRGDGDVFYAVGLTGDNPKFTLTEDPMHDNCAPCQAGLPEETHEPPDTMLKTAAKTILMVLAVATAAAFMQWCG